MRSSFESDASLSHWNTSPDNHAFTSDGEISNRSHSSCMIRWSGRLEKHYLKLDTHFLDLSKTACLDKETKVMAMALEKGRLTNLKALLLDGNMADIGVRSFFTALENGHLVQLEKLICWQISSYDQITTREEGTKRIAKSIAECKLANLKMLDLKGCLQKLGSRRSFSQTIFDCLFCRVPSKCKSSLWKGCLMSCATGGGLCCIPYVLTGDAGLELIVDALEKCSQEKLLTILYLEGNYISDTGAKSLATILGKGLLPYLDVLDLHDNEIGKEGAEAFVDAFLYNPLLTAEIQMDWPQGVLEAEAEAFRECNMRLEHLLDNDLREKIPREEIAIGPKHYKRLKYWLDGPVRVSSRLGCTRFRQRSRRLFIDCQGPDCKFPRHCEGQDKPQGIVIEKRSFRGKKSNPYHGTDRSGEVHITYISRDFINNASIRSAGEGCDIDKEEVDDSETNGQVHQWNTGETKKADVGEAKSCEKQGQGRQTRNAVGKTKNEEDKETKTILKELLMLAARKPEEFFAKFGLRRVLFKDPSSDEYRDKYRALCLCNTCITKAHEDDVICLWTQNENIR